MAEIQVPSLRFLPPQPVNLVEMLEAQTKRLIEVGVPGEVGVKKAKFLDDAMEKAAEFTYSVELAAIGLDRVVMVHYELRDCHLVEVGGINPWADPDEFTLYEGVVIPEGLHIFQGQLGPKYRRRKPRDIRYSHNPLEELGVANEGLTAFLYWGKPLLEECNMDFPGSVSEHGYVPSLSWDGDGPNLAVYYDADGDPDYGSVSRGK